MFVWRGRLWGRRRFKVGDIVHWTCPGKDGEYTSGDNRFLPTGRRGAEEFGNEDDPDDHTEVWQCGECGLTIGVSEETRSIYI